MNPLKHYLWHYPNYYHVKCAKVIHITVTGSVIPLQSLFLTLRICVYNNIQNYERKNFIFLILSLLQCTSYKFINFFYICIFYEASAGVSKMD